MTDMKTIAEHIERALDEALKMTFPASDPVAVDVPQPALIQAGPTSKMLFSRSRSLS
jgi:hypothetical protein